MGVNVLFLDDQHRGGGAGGLAQLQVYVLFLFLHDKYRAGRVVHLKLYVLFLGVWWYNLSYIYFF